MSRSQAFQSVLGSGSVNILTYNSSRGAKIQIRHNSFVALRAAQKYYKR